MFLSLGHFLVHTPKNSFIAKKKKNSSLKLNVWCIYWLQTRANATKRSVESRHVWVSVGWRATTLIMTFLKHAFSCTKVYAEDRPLQGDNDVGHALGFSKAAIGVTREVISRSYNMMNIHLQIKVITSETECIIYFSLWEEKTDLSEQPDDATLRKTSFRAQSLSLIMVSP